MEAWGARYRQDQSNVEAAIKYARALRAIGQRAQAVAVLEQAAIRNPQNMPLLGEYGRALAAAGNLQQALDVLSRAHTPDNPDWRILSAQGAVLDQLGRHTEAQQHYTSALKLMPDEPSVLSNLGLSYLLTKDLKRAEDTLRRAAAQPGAEPKVRQNLALVVGLRGKFAEAEQIARQGLPPDEAAANVDYLKQVLAERKRGGKAYVPSPNSGG
jgi:Flp pilus assembly protein TadD